MSAEYNSAHTSLIQNDMAIEGEVRNAGSIEIRGSVIGSIEAGRITVAENGRIHGDTVADSLSVSGEVQGTTKVRDDVAVASSGRLAGDLQYSQISVEPGGELSADLRNVPPELFGDLAMSVRRGGRSTVTTEDLTAVDPDDSAEDLTFIVSDQQHCRIEIGEAEGIAVSQFSLADIEAGRVTVVHDGSSAQTASFAVNVVDDDGATSGAPQVVNVSVHAG